MNDSIKVKKLIALTLFGLAFIQRPINAQIYPTIDGSLVSNPIYKPGYDLVLNADFEDGTIPSEFYYMNGLAGGPWYADPQYVSVQNGKLILEIEYDPHMQADATNPSIVQHVDFGLGGLRIKKSVISFEPGMYIEIKSKMPKGSIIHPGCFTWGCDTSYGFPITTNRHSCTTTGTAYADTAWHDQNDCAWSEIDITERPGCSATNLRSYHSNYHSRTLGDDFKYECSKEQSFDSSLPGWGDAFYTVGMLWEDDKISYYVNNRLVRVATVRIPQYEAGLEVSLGLHGTYSPTVYNQLLTDYLQDQGKYPFWEIEYIRIYKPRCEVERLHNDFGHSKGWLSQNESYRSIGDFNGDNKQDLIGFGYSGVSVAFAPVTTGASFSGLQLPLNDFGHVQGWQDQDKMPRLIGDINDDGKDDIVAFGTNYTSATLSTTPSFGTTSSFGSVTAIVNDFDLSHGWLSQNRSPIQLADVDGDGKMDIVGFGYKHTRVALSTTSSASVIPSFTQAYYVLQDFAHDQGWDYQDSHPRLLGDINGDGKADIVAFNEQGTYVSFSNTNGGTPGFTPKSFVFAEYGMNQGWLSFDKSPRFLADVNGDGRDDIIGFGYSGVMLSLSQCTGSTVSFTAPIIVLNHYGHLQDWLSQNEMPRVVKDINCDGYADILGFGNNSVQVALGQANGTFTNYQNVVDNYSHLEFWMEQEKSPRFLGDFSGDGALDIIGYGSGGVYAYSCFECFDPNRKDKRSQALSNDLGVNKKLGQTSEIDIQLYPNPSDGEIYLAGIHATEIQFLKLFDNRGQLLFSTRIEDVEKPISLPENLKGLYIIYLENGSQTFIERLIIQ